MLGDNLHARYMQNLARMQKRMLWKQNSASREKTTDDGTCIGSTSSCHATHGHAPAYMVTSGDVHGMCTCVHSGWTPCLLGLWSAPQLLARPYNPATFTLQRTIPTTIPTPHAARHLPSSLHGTHCSLHDILQDLKEEAVVAAALRSKARRGSAGLQESAAALRALRAEHAASVAETNAAMHQMGSSEPATEAAIRSNATYSAYTP